MNPPNTSSAAGEGQRKPENWEHEGSYEIVCPYCGYTFQDSWDFSDDASDLECDRCGRTFEYQREVSVTYSTKQKAEAA